MIRPRYYTSLLYAPFIRATDYSDTDRCKRKRCFQLNYITLKTSIQLFLVYIRLIKRKPPLIGEGYEFLLSEGLPVFVLEFGEPEIDFWYAISWGGGNVTVEDGQIMYHRVYVGDVTYTTIPEEVNESSNTN